MWMKSALNLSWWMPLLYRNHFIDLQNKPMDWFLYDKNLHHEIVNALLLACIYQRRSHRRGHSLTLQFPNQTRSKIFSLTQKGYCFLRMFRNYSGQKFHNFYSACYSFWTIYGGFSFFLTMQGKWISSRWTSWKGPISNAEPSDKFLFVNHPKEDHNEREFKS